MTDLSHLFDSPECLALYRVKRERDELRANPFRALDADEIQLLVCALAGNYPPKLAHLRMGVLRRLARASREAEAA